MAFIQKAVSIAATVIFFPLVSHAQVLADEIKSLHSVLDQLYNEMMPMCSQLIGIAQGIAGFAALWYIGSRVWKNIANAESVDFYPLFRPFVIGFCITIFPSVLELINVVLKPTVTGTAAMIEGSDKAIAILLKQREEALTKTTAWQMYMGFSGNGDREEWYRYTHDGADPDSEGMIDGIGNDIKFAMAKAAFSFRSSVKEWMSEVLRLLFEAAALCINTLRTFQLVVLSILGPLVFGLAVFDGFQHTLTVWLARYINVFLWLPVANLFGSIIGKIQEKMIELDISQVNTHGDTFFSTTDTAYIVFLIIGIIGYFTVPSIANYIVHAGGGSALTQKVTLLLSNSSRSVINTTSAGAGMVKDSLGDTFSSISQNMASYRNSSSYFNDKKDSGDGYMSDKIKEIKMFTKAKNIETSFRQVRQFAMVVVVASTIVCCFTLYASFRYLALGQDRIYVLANGKAIEAFASSGRDNLPVEAKSHVTSFHELFFSFDPDEKVIDDNIKKLCIWLINRLKLCMEISKRRGTMQTSFQVT